MLFISVQSWSIASGFVWINRVMHLSILELHHMMTSPFTSSWPMSLCATTLVFALFNMAILNFQFILVTLNITHVFSLGKFPAVLVSREGLHNTICFHQTQVPLQVPSRAFRDEHQSYEASHFWALPPDCHIQQRHLLPSCVLSFQMTA